MASEATIKRVDLTRENKVPRGEGLMVPEVPQGSLL